MAPVLTNPFIKFPSVQWVSAITDWLKRASITINGAKKTATFSDDFSGTDDWTDDGTNVAVNTTTDVIDWNANTTMTDATVNDRTSINDSEWNMRFKWTINNKTTNSDGTQQMFFAGVSDSDHLSNRSDNQDFIGFVAWIGSSNTFFRLVHTDGTTPFDGDSSATLDATVLTTGDFYCEIVRNSATKMTVTIYADSDYSEVLTSRSVTVASTISSLRYLKFFCQESDGTSNGTFDGTIDDVEFYDGESVVENIPSQQTATFEDDFNTDDWTDSGTLCAVNTGTEVLDFDASVNNVNHGTYYDLGAGNVDDEKWVLRWKHTVDAKTQNTTTDISLFVGLSDNLAESRTSSNCITLFSHISTSNAGVYAIRDTNNSGVYTTASDASFSHALAVETVYIELKRTSSTTYECSLYSDSNYSTLIERKTGTVSASTTGLRYIRVFNDSEGTGTSDHVYNGTIDDLQFWNNITEVNPSTLTDYPVPVKISGFSGIQRKTTETLEDLFTSDGWTDADANIGVNTTDQRLDFSILRDNTADGSYIDLTSVSDTTWVFDCDLYITAVTAVASGNADGYLGISSTTGDGATSQDFIGIRIGNRPTPIYATIDSDGTNLNIAEDGVFSTVLQTGNILFIRMKRLSATKYNVSFYADKARTILIESQNGTCASTTNTLRYLKLVNANFSTLAGNIDGYIKNVRFWNGITNPVTQETATFSDDFSGTDDFTDSGTGFGVNVTTDVFDWDIATANANNQSVYDLTSVDKEFNLRFKYTVDNITQGSDATPVGFGFGISDSDESVGGTSNQNAIGFKSFLNNGTPEYSLVYAENSTFSSSSNKTTLTITPTSLGTATRYVEILVKNKIATLNIYTDSDYSILSESVTLAIPDGVFDGLRYLKFCNRDNGDGTEDHVFDGTIDDVQFWNGISSPNASARKFVFTDNVLDDTATEYSSETISYDPINGDYYGYVKIPSLTTGADTTIQMYYDYQPSANPSYVPDDSTVTLVQGADNTLTQNTSSDTSGLNWGQADSGGAGLQVNSGHVLVGKRISAITVYMKYATSNSSPAQNMVCKHFGSTPATIRSTATETPSSSTLTTSYQSYTYNFANPVNIQAGDHIMVVGDTDGGTGAWHFDIEGADGDANINFTTWTDNSASFTEQTGRELRYSITYHEAGNREQSTWDSNHKAVYHLQGNSIDSTVNGNDGTETSVDWEERNNSVGLVADASTTVIDCGTNSSLTDLFATGGHATVWINPKSDGESNLGTFLDKRDSASTGGFRWYTNAESGGLLEVRFIAQFTTTLGRWGTGVIIPINELTRLDVFYDASSVDNDPIMLVNGIKVSVDETSTPAGTYEGDSAEALTIGDLQSGTTGFDGFIDNVTLSDKIRPSSQAIATYNAEKSDTDMVTVGTEESQ